MLLKWPRRIICKFRERSSGERFPSLLRSQNTSPRASIGKTFWSPDFSMDVILCRAKAKTDISRLFELTANSRASLWTASPQALSPTFDNSKVLNSMVRDVSAPPLSRFASISMCIDRTKKAITSPSSHAATKTSSVPRSATMRWLTACGLVRSI